ncbi:MAG: hypothetical protein HY240_05460 [Actinobacteria bacterium]|nr:hypothetical protein [Actinomycetota bacterium]
MAASSRPGEDRPAGAPAAAGNGARRVRLALVLVGVGWLAAQLLVCSPHRPPSWDEAIYLSQVRPPALPFAASRSRGIVALAAPVVAAGGSIFQVRVWLAVASALALVAAFWPWT